MSCKSLIYVATTTPTSVVANGILPLTTIIRRRGRILSAGGNSILISDCGSSYYTVTVTATFTAPVAGTVSLALQQNGMTIPGAVASTTITTAITEVRSLSFTVDVRTFNSCSVDSLTILNTGVAITLSNVAVTVEQD